MKANLKYGVAFYLATLIAGCSKPALNSETVTLEKKWETPATLLTPESVLYDKGNNVLYVSNINGKAGDKDGNGSIGKVSVTGKVENAEWVKGLDAPKGMGLYQSMLYVADLTKVIVIDVKTGQKLKEIELPGAQFLNDITVDSKGNIYVSDSAGKKVYKITNNVATVLLENDLLTRPNGLLAHENKLYLVNMADGIFYQINEEAKSLTKLAEGLTAGDGIVPVGNGAFLVSNWNGEINFISPTGQVKKLLDTKDAKINAADIEFIPGLNLVLIPTFFDNKVVAYQLK